MRQREVFAAFLAGNRHDSFFQSNPGRNTVSFLFRATGFTGNTYLFQAPAGTALYADLALSIGHCRGHLAALRLLALWFYGARVRSHVQSKESGKVFAA